MCIKRFISLRINEVFLYGPGLDSTFHMAATDFGPSWGTILTTLWHRRRTLMGHKVRLEPFILHSLRTIVATVIAE